MGNSSENNVYQNYIDGKWVAAADTFAIINPATEEIVAEAPNGSRQDTKGISTRQHRLRPHRPFFTPARAAR